MSALKNMPISFPGLFGDWELNIDPVAIHIGHGIYWYGIILAFAMLAGLYLCMKQAKHYGLTEDNIMDMVLWAVPCCIIGARFYYVLFYLDLYRNTDGSLDWGAMFRIWDGGLAIYGAVIAGVLVALTYTKRHKLPFFAMGDVAVMGLCEESLSDHIHVDPCHEGLDSDFVIVSDSVVNAFIDCNVVRYHKSVPTPLFAQNIGHKPAVNGCGHVIDDIE